ncbi:hypothetical protein JKP88DRAFT_236483 [Tribonema minus]|uniref:Uncharacterized protein n=1 Tax=Tribonema minus TaxID=303371 RepID=A0A835Z980_9STRA|nr:hypothetical protein JKP88DRAFT_236483 [Tribonema minus]
MPAAALAEAAAAAAAAVVAARADFAMAWPRCRSEPLHLSEAAAQRGGAAMLVCTCCARSFCAASSSRPSGCASLPGVLFAGEDQVLYRAACAGATVSDPALLHPDRARACAASCTDRQQQRCSQCCFGTVTRKGVHTCRAVPLRVAAAAPLFCRCIGSA